MNSTRLTVRSPVVGWALLIVGIMATGSAWRNRHPDTTSDFTLFYVSAQHSSPEMFAQPPGPPRGNMNPPLFQLMIRPLTAFPLPTAGAIFRVLNILALCGCIWWLARSSAEPWTLADYGALLAWAPMASVIALNQLTWILWPPLLWAWWCWRQDRWIAGAIGYGLALSLKPFLGVILLWLLVTKRWSAALVTCIVGTLAFAVGLAVYGIDVNLAWVEAMRDVTWAYAGMNGALQGLLVRAMDKPIPISVPLFYAPGLVGPLSAALGAVIVMVTLIRTRRQHIDQAWLPLMVSALLASPLGWLYYIWWLLPGTRPSQLLRESPLLWMPMVFPLLLEPSSWLGLTLGSVYFWGLFGLWLHRICFGPAPAESSDAVEPAALAQRSLALRVGVVALIFVAITIARGQFVAAKQIVENDPVIGVWELDRARSTFDPDAGVESRTVTFAPVDTAIRQTTLTQTTDGKSDQVQYTARYNGKDHVVQRSFIELVSLKRVDRNTVERLGKVGTQVVETETRTVSPDGGMLTITTRGTRDDADYRSVQVFKRVS